MDVIVALPNDLESAAMLDGLLVAVPHPAVGRILVVEDQCSEPVRGQLASLADADSRMEVIRTGRRLGRVRSSNLALARTTAPVVLLVDPMPTLAPEDVARFIGCFGHLPDADVVIGGEVDRWDEAMFAVSRRAIEALDDFDLVFRDGGGERIDFAMRARYEELTSLLLDTVTGDVRELPGLVPLPRDVPEANREILEVRWSVAENSENVNRDSTYAVEVEIRTAE